MGFMSSVLNIVSATADTCVKTSQGLIKIGSAVTATTVNAASAANNLAETANAISYNWSQTMQTKSAIDTKIALDKLKYESTIKQQEMQVDVIDKQVQLAEKGANIFNHPKGESRLACLKELNKDNGEIQEMISSLYKLHGIDRKTNQVDDIDDSSNKSPFRK